MSGGATYFDAHIGGGQTIVPFLGDVDRRNNALGGITFVKPDRWLRIRRWKGELVQELYYEHSISIGRKSPNIPRSHYDAVGYIFGARYTWMLPRRFRLYADIGWGAQYLTRTTHDLSDRFNSTPFADVGTWIGAGKHQVSVSLRLLHSSNAGLVHPNVGQNQLFVMLGMTF